MKKKSWLWRTLLVGFLSLFLVTGAFYGGVAWCQEEEPEEEPEPAPQSRPRPDALRKGGGSGMSGAAQQKPAGSYFKSRLQQMKAGAPGQSFRPESPAGQGEDYSGRPRPAWDPGERPKSPMQAVSDDGQHGHGAISPMRPEAPMQTGRPEMPAGIMKPGGGTGIIDVPTQRPEMPMGTMRPAAPVLDMQRPASPTQGIQRPAAPMQQTRPEMQAPMQK
ncbi:MAG: hypothetical protein PVG99_08265 [Desulfobacteraceae bacterium]|jgi:hypothetical protein